VDLLDRVHEAVLVLCDDESSKEIYRQTPANVMKQKCDRFYTMTSEEVMEKLICLRQEVVMLGYFAD